MKAANGHCVIACYRPRPGKESELVEIVREHVPTLRRLGLATPRPVVVLRCGDGTLLEIFEWVSSQAVERAHHDPVVQQIWERFGRACDFTTLSGLQEANQPFAHFEPVDLQPAAAL